MKFAAPEKIILLGLVLVLTACGAENEIVSEEPVVRPAKLLTLEHRRNEVLHEFTGRIEALTSVDVSFEVGGPLRELPVREGETLASGALVAAIDSTDFELSVRESEVQLQLAAQDLRRKQQVLEEKAIARSTVQDAQALYDLQKVRLEQAQERLADTRIFAPFEAYVSRRYVENHVILAPSQPVVRLHDLGELLVVVNMPQSIVATVSADHVLDAWAEFSFAPGRRFPLVYRENRGEADALVQTYEVSFVMANPDDLTLLPGMTALLNLVLRGESEGFMVLPAAALVPAADNSLSVWVYDPVTQRVSRRMVETGPPLQNGVPVISGLNIGETVVISGASQLHEGMKVRPFESR